MESFMTALRRAGRRLLRAPAFSLTVVVMLALGIGATTAVFALVYGVLLRPLPFAAADRLVSLQHSAPGFGVSETGISRGLYLHYRQESRVLEEVGAYFESSVTLTDQGSPERVQRAVVSPSVFSILGVRPFLGRLFVEEDSRPGAVGSVLISHDLWVRRYGSDPGVVGRTIEVNRGTHEIAGVLPPGFHFPHRETEVWYSMTEAASEARVRDMFLGGIARLRPGATPEQAEAELRRLVPGLVEAYPDVTPELLRESRLRPVVVPYSETIVGALRPTLMLLFLTAGGVLLIAWANIANLALVRAERHARDVAVEQALGATHRHLARRFLSESLLLSLVGGGLGLALAYMGIRLRFGFQPDGIPRLYDVRMDGLVVGVALALSVLSGILLGMVFLLRMRRPALTTALKGTLGRMTTDRRGQHLQRVLVGFQVALALTLLIGSAMMVRSVWLVRQLDPGFEPAGVLTLEVPLPARQYRSYEDAVRFHTTLLEQLRLLPGVRGAEAARHVPLTPPSSTEPLAAADGPPVPGAFEPAAAANLVTPGYFATMGIPLLEGRTFQREDLDARVPGAVISESLARDLFRASSPIGRRIRLTNRESYPAFTVVGVAGDVPGSEITADPERMLYLPVLRSFPAAGEERPFPFVPRNMVVTIRSDLPATSLISTVRRSIAEVDPKVPVVRVRTMDDLVAASTAQLRLTTLLLLIAAATALCLGVVGLYGVVSYAVSQRTPELGVRLAMGATPADVRRLVLRQSALVALAGIAAGVLAAFAVMRLLRGLLYQVSPSEPGAYLAMALLMFSVAVAASYIPARRAGRVDPMRALADGQR